ncbi:ankyrin repeat and SAM domain-containing protein flippy [Rhynchophorus ferrugineus]|uniref:ankyrin repeat and SAM domain-containing protein flippy n=1 Tax=Rhynchophorus ferrugineus TaxID=354439 RepID=UPI003FCC9161
MYDNCNCWIYFRFSSGRKAQFTVTGLAPCTCYNFRLKSVSDGEWSYFKAGTIDLGPYTSVMHMTRALKLGKTSVIRKISCLKPSLLNIENKERKTPLIQAIQNDDMQILQLLITLGANVNKPLLVTQRTPLMYAIYDGHLKAASLLIDKGADIFSKDINGLNIMHYAVDSDKLESVKFTFNAKININEQDNKGWTPLYRAVILKCNPEIIQYLLENGADPTLKDNNGFDYYKHSKLSHWKA